MTLLEWARFYVHEKGFSVFSLKFRSKHPAIPWKEFQLRKPTDEELITWFSAGYKNIAIVTGAISNLTVVDLDSEEAVNFAKQKGFSDTPTVKTSKGYHLYYKYFSGTRNFQKSQNLNGIDLRSEGGYVLAPPSIHPSGVEYKWLDAKRVDELLCADLPDIIVNEAAQQTSANNLKIKKPDVTELIKKCQFFEYCYENRRELSEELWRAMLSNVAKISPGGIDLCHAMSRDHSYYSAEETTRKILQTINASSPITCAWIKQRHNCGKECKVTSPAVLFYQKQDVVDEDLPIKNRIIGIMTQRGNSILKSDEIARIIIDDVEKNEGEFVSYNYKQEIALILKGRDILVDERVVIYFKERFGYVPSETLWRNVIDRIFAYTLEKPSVRIYNYSMFQNNKIYIGLKDKGNLVISKDNVAIKPQGFDDIYIQCENSLNLTDEILLKHFLNPDVSGGSVLDNIFSALNYDGNDEEQKFLMSAWFYYSIFGHPSTVRPILTFFAPRDSGKTFLMKTLKGILHGFNDCEPSILPKEDYEWVLTCKANKHLFIDEFNEVNEEVKTRLRMAVTGQEFRFRPKYAKDLIHFKADNWIVVGSNKSKYGDPDITQRMILIYLKPVEAKQQRDFSDEKYFTTLSTIRLTLWLDIIGNLQKILMNLFVNKDKIPEALSNRCRLMSFFDFAYKAFPEQNELCLKVFNNLDSKQVSLSAETDSVITFFETFVENHSAYQEKGVFQYYSKQILVSLRDIARECGEKLYIKTSHSMGRWLNDRYTYLNEQYGVERKNRHNQWLYVIPSSGKKEKEDDDEMFIAEQPKNIVQRGSEE